MSDRTGSASTGDRHDEGAAPPTVPDIDLGGPDVVASLARWVARARVDEAARGRSRESWLRRQQVEETTFVGVLADLAERNRAVTLDVDGRRQHRGIVRGLGRDFVALGLESTRHVLIRREAIVAVRTRPEEAEALSGRTVSLELGFDDALTALAAERPRVVVGLSTDETVTGELRAVGADVVTMRADGTPGATVYVPLDAIVDLTIV